MIDPRAHGCESLEALALAWLDGALDPAAGAAIERETAESADLRRAVARARSLRALLARVPRREAPARVREYAARLATLRGHSDSIDSGADAHLPPVGALLASLPRRSAPQELTDRIVAFARAEAETLVVVRQRRAFRSRRWFGAVARSLAAAAVLFAVTALLSDGVAISSRASQKLRAAQSSGRVFEVAIARPGTPAIGEFYDPILAPRPFDALPQPRPAGTPNAADPLGPDVPGADDR